MNKTYKTLKVILLCTFSFTVLAAENRFETEKLIYWQPKVKIEYKDFTSGPENVVDSRLSVYKEYACFSQA